MGRKLKSVEARQFFLVGTPIGNLGDITLRAIETLRAVDTIYCEDTRRTLKLLNALEIKKPLQSAPYFKERSASQKMLRDLQAGKTVAFVSDAGMPGLSDPGTILLQTAREAGFRTEVVGGVSALTQFISGLGMELESFFFTGFLPHKKTQRLKLLQDRAGDHLIFFESPHRIESSLQLVAENFPQARLSLAKELTKLSEAYFHGTAQELLDAIPSWKGEWLGLVWPHVDA